LFQKDVVCFFVLRDVSEESAENIERRAWVADPRHGPPASRIKVGRLIADGRRRFDVRTQVSDAISAAEKHPGS